MSQHPTHKARERYVERWRQLSQPARLYLLHAALLTGSLAIFGVFFNLAIPALGFSLTFLGTLNTLSIAVAAILSVPLWWLVTRIGLQRALVLSASLQALGIVLAAFWPSAAFLLIAVALSGAAATIFQVSAPPFMMEQSDEATRDHLFSANMAVNIGFAGIVTFFAGDLKAWLGTILGVGAETGLAYCATFAVAGLGLALSIVPLFLMRSQRKPAVPAVVSNVDTGAPMYAAASEFHAQPAKHSQAEDSDWLRYARFLAPYLVQLPHPIQRLLRRPTIVLPLLVSPLLISFGAAGLIIYLNIFFKQRFDISDVTVGRIIAILGIATGIASLAGPIISTRLGKAQTIVLTQVVSIPFLLILGFVPLLNVAVAAALMRGALFNMGSPLYDAFAMERTDEDLRPIVIGLINGAYSVGYLVSPKLSTWVQEQYGFGPLFIATAILYALAALTNYVLFVRRKKHSRSPVDPSASEVVS